MEFTNEELINFLKKNDIRPSNIRLKVLKYLLENRIHPSAEDIYNGVIYEIPTLSRTSVYNTINLFKEKGIVSELYLDDKEVRYDINTKLHGHFKCEECGRVYDFPVTSILHSGLEGFVIKKKEINYYGVCINCQ